MNQIRLCKVLEIEMTRKKISTNSEYQKMDAPDQQEKAGKEQEAADDQMFIAGIGGSAGGLEAFEEFFRNLSADTGVGFVVITHMDPFKKDIMHDIIRRYTDMPVEQAQNDTKVLPNHIYVIPPNTDMTISGGVLKLGEPSTKKGVRMPIDVFLRSLAEDQREKSIALIFSGMGTDGVLGIKAIKEKNGTVMAQDPAEAKFDSMPQSAINTGMVDYVAPANDLPEQLREFVINYHLLLSRKPEERHAPSNIERILKIVRQRTGHDFTEYKQSTVFRRIERRMTVHQIRDLDGYIDYLKGHPEETELLFKELLIGVTSFFRDPEAFEVLMNEAIPEMLTRVPPNSLIRIWVPGCSTGEEAYSIAIVLDECLGDRPNKVQSFATDIDAEAIEYARKGVYPGNIAADVDEMRLQKYFTREEDNFKIKKAIREMIIFAEQDVAHDPPFTGLDLISCRNLLIYLMQDMQNKIISLFSYALNPQGILFLGSSETLGREADMFTTVSNKWKIYTRKGYTTRREVQTVIPIATSSPVERMKIQAGGFKPTIGEMAHQVLLEAFAPPAAIIDQNGEVMYIQGRKYLEPAPGKASMNIVAMARKGLGTELGIAIEKAKRNNVDVAVKDVEIQTDGHTRAINFTVKPIRAPEAMKNLLLVAFQDVEKPPERKPAEGIAPEKEEAFGRVNEELRYTKEKLQSTMEEMHASQEEMRSMNEELQSTNEELQSTNEELTTSKEELQSLNEELVTVNSELQAKVDDLTRANNDIKNLLYSTDIASVFLDENLKITRFTPSATRIINLLPSDIGRPITDISTKIRGTDPNMIVTESYRVLEKLGEAKTMVETKDDHWYSMRILPYRTVDNVISGVVITFADITDMKRMEQANAAAKEFSEAIVATVSEPLIVLDSTMRVVMANKAFYNTFRVTPEETQGKQLFELGNKQWDIPSLRKQLDKVLPKKKAFEDFRVELDFPRIGHRVMVLNARKIDIAGGDGLILLAIKEETP